MISEIPLNWFVMFNSGGHWASVAMHWVGNGIQVGSWKFVTEKAAKLNPRGLSQISKGSEKFAELLDQTFRTLTSALDPLTELI